MNLLTCIIVRWGCQNKSTVPHTRKRGISSQKVKIRLKSNNATEREKYQQETPLKSNKHDTNGDNTRKNSKCSKIIITIIITNKTKGASITFPNVSIRNEGLPEILKEDNGKTSNEVRLCGSVAHFLPEGLAARWGVEQQITAPPSSQAARGAPPEERPLQI